MKRMICAALALCLLAGTLSGCGGKDQGGDKPMGRYIEEQGELLEGLSQVYRLYQADDGSLVFYGNYPQEGQNRYTRNVLPKGGTQVERTDVEWLNALETDGRIVMDVSESQSGTVYALLMGEPGVSYLYRSENGGEAELVEVPDWVATEDSGGNVAVSKGSSTEISFTGSASFAIEGAQPVNMGKYVAGIIALEDGFLACLGQSGVSRYDKSGKLLAEFPGMGFQASVNGNLLLMSAPDGKDLWTYDLTKNEQAGSTTYESLSFNVLTGLDAEGLYLADSTGIYRQTKDGSIWERLVEGDLTSLAMPNQTLRGLTSDGSGGFYGIMNSDETYRMMHYVYSAETPTNPDTELTIFSLKDNNTVRQAIGEFQRQNPNVRVNFRAAMADESAATTEDVIRSLNTELLAGKGPDLILLDGLPVDSYIEKEVLADMTALVEELTTQGVMPNFMGAYERDGKQYGVPSRFGFPIMMGSGEFVDKITSLEELLAQVEVHQGDKPPLLYPSDELWSDNGMILDYYSVSAGTFLKDGSVDEAALTAYFSSMARLNQIMREKTPQSDGAMVTISAVASTNSAGFELMNMGPRSLADELARFHIQDLSGLINLSNIVDNLGDLEGQKLSNLFGGDVYQPMGGVGIVSSGKQQELAQSFVKMLLSPTVQDKYLYDGFAVNGPSLEKQVADELMESGGDDMGFLALCKSLNTPLLADQVVRDAVAAQAKDLADGTITPAGAAANVIEKTKIYLSE